MSLSPCASVPLIFVRERRLIVGGSDLDYNPEWILAVLEDLKEFADANGMPKTSIAIMKTTLAARMEFSELAANDDGTAQGNRRLS